MFQLSVIPFGTDATKVAGYAIATDRLGNVDLQINNIGSNTLYMKVAQFTSGTTSSYTTIVPLFSVVAGGVVTKSLAVAGTKQLAFFGSGSTSANITPIFRNPADLRGATIDIVPVGRFAWTFDTSLDSEQNFPTWPSLPTDGPISQ